MPPERTRHEGDADETHGRISALVSRIRPRLPAIVAGVVLLVLAGVHLYLISQTFWITPDGAAHSTLEGYGDIPLHLTQISKFAFGSIWSLGEPIYYGGRLAYPFLVNLASGLLLRLTGAWRFSVLLPVWLAAVGSLLLTYKVYLQVLGRRSHSLIALLLFYLAGGLAAANRFDRVYPAQNLDYGAPLTLVLVHQRAFLLGLLLAGLLVWSTYRAGRVSGRRRWVYRIVGILSYGILPLAHMHTFAAMSITLVVWALVSLWQRERDRFRGLAMTLACGGIIALPQVLYLLGDRGASGAPSSLAKLRLGWMTEPGIGAAVFPPGTVPTPFSIRYLDFLWLNLGLLLPVFVLALLVVSQAFRRERDIASEAVPRQSGTLLAWGLAALAVFAVVMLVRFQPWDYDDNKLLVYWQWLAAPVVVWAIAKVFASRQASASAVLVVLLIVTSWPGVQDAAKRMLTPPDALPVIFSADAFRLAGYVRSLPDTDLVVTSDTHLNPVDSLAGRAVYIGYPGWLWTRGLPYADREALLKAFYADPATLSPRLLALFPARYALIDDMARNDWRANVAGFDRLYPLAFVAGPYRLYRLAPKPE